MRRHVFTAHPAGSDYVLNSTGLTWGIRRTTVDGSATIVSAGERSRTVAVAMVVALAEDAKVDAWEPVGNREFRLIKRCRPSA